jgi:uncharacterized protein YuzE
MKKTIQATFDKSADALYIKLKRGKVKKTFTKGDSFIVDLDQKGEILGLEILQYSKLLSAARKKMAAPASS